MANLGTASCATRRRAGARERSSYKVETCTFLIRAFSINICTNVAPSREEHDRRYVPVAWLRTVVGARIVRLSAAVAVAQWLMGVPAFFAWLVRKYPEALTDVPGDVDGDVASRGTDSTRRSRRRKGESSSARRQRVSERSRDGGDDCSDPCANWRCDNLYLDMNGIIHPCCHPEGGKPQPATEAEMFENVAALLDNLVAQLKPMKLLFLAIDGVAPRAKMNQQRARRFRSQADAQQARVIEAKLRAKMLQQGLPVPPERPPAWDHNVITPGTKFMADLADYLRKLIADRVAHHAAWKHLAVVLSDASVPGEGEHKLVEFVRRSQGQPNYDPNTRHVIVGDDADLIMLALATHELHFTIVRTRRFTDRLAEAEAAAKEALALDKRDPAKATSTAANVLANSRDPHLLDGARAATLVVEASKDEAEAASQWQLLHISVLREYLWLEFAGYLQRANDHDDVSCAGHEHVRTAFERLIDDFVFLCFFVGNDFLPHLPSLDIREGALDLLLQLYKSVILTPKPRQTVCTQLVNEQGQRDFRWSPRWLTDAGDVDFGSLYPLIERLGQVEVAIFDRRRQRAARESKPKNQTQCAFFARQGYCREGDSCPFLHGDTCPLDAKNATLEIELRQKLQVFASSRDKELALGTEMNSYQRRVCHKIAEQFQLGHESRGDGKQRQIYVWRLGEHKVQQKDRDDGMVKEMFDNALREAIEKAENAEALALDDGLVLGQGDEWCGDYYQVKFGRLRPDGFAEPPGTACPQSGQSKSTGGTSRAPPEGLLHEYLQGLQWVLQYYYKGVPSWSWFFRFHYAPTATDLGRTLQPRPSHPTGSYRPTPFAMSTPLDPISQLMGVFPAASAASLPTVCQELMSSQHSPVIDFYPVKFVLDPNGARMRWQWIALLPFIDEIRLRRVVRERVLPQLTKEEQVRNSAGAALLFAHRESVLGQALVNKLSHQSGTTVKIDLQHEEHGAGGARSTDCRPIPLPGQVWVPKRRVTKALARLRGAQAFVVAGYALDTQPDHVRTIGIQPGAIPPPAVLRPASSGDRRGPRPRMLLVDLQAVIKRRKREKQHAGSASAPAASAANVRYGAGRGGMGRGKGERGTDEGRGGLGRARGGRGNRGNSTVRGTGRARGRPRGRARAAGRLSTHQQQLFVLDRVGASTQHRNGGDDTQAAIGARESSKLGNNGKPHKRVLSQTESLTTDVSTESSTRSEKKRGRRICDAANSQIKNDGEKKPKRRKTDKHKKRKKKRLDKKHRSIKGNRIGDNGAELFVIDRTGATDR